MLVKVQILFTLGSHISFKLYTQYINIQMLCIVYSSTHIFQFLITPINIKIIFILVKNIAFLYS